MMDLPKPRVIVSKCLGFSACRYDGEMIHDRFVESLKSIVEFLPICPEVECGLGVPRDPIRIVLQDGKRCLIQPAKDRYITEMMSSFLSRFLYKLDSVQGFILKSRSPSCGPTDVKIYSDKESDVELKRSVGFFAEAVLEQFPEIPIEDENRLQNPAIQEQFLNRIFQGENFKKGDL